MQAIVNDDYGDKGTNFFWANDRGAGCRQNHRYANDLRLLSVKTARHDQWEEAVFSLRPGNGAAGVHPTFILGSKACLFVPT